MYQVYKEALPDTAVRLHHSKAIKKKKKKKEKHL